MTQALVDRDALGSLLVRAWSMFELLAEESGFDERTLEPGSELVTLAVQAGLPIPGPLAPGTVPPPPPVHHEGICAPTFRADGGKTLRCVPCGKVVYTNIRGAESACRLIAERQAMRPYMGPCGHYHISRDKHAHGRDVHRRLEQGGSDASQG